MSRLTDCVSWANVDSYTSGWPELSVDAKAFVKVPVNHNTWDVHVGKIDWLYLKKFDWGFPTWSYQVVPSPRTAMNKE